MKTYFIMAVMTVLTVTAVQASDWRNAAESLYGVPTASDATNGRLQAIAESNEGARNGDTMRKDLRGSSFSVTVIGCNVQNTYGSAYDHSDSNTSSITNTTTCTNTGAVSGNLNFNAK